MQLNLRERTFLASLEAVLRGRLFVLLSSGQVAYPLPGAPAARHDQRPRPGFPAHATTSDRGQKQPLCPISGFRYQFLSYSTGLKQGEQLLTTENRPKSGTFYGELSFYTKENGTNCLFWGKLVAISQN